MRVFKIYEYSISSEWWMEMMDMVVDDEKKIINFWGFERMRHERGE